MYKNQVLESSIRIVLDFYFVIFKKKNEHLETNQIIQSLMNFLIEYLLEHNLELKRDLIIKSN